MFIFESGSICTYSLEFYSTLKECWCSRQAGFSMMFCVSCWMGSMVLSNWKWKSFCLWFIIGFYKDGYAFMFTLCGFMESNLFDLPFIYLFDLFNWIKIPWALSSSSGRLVYVYFLPMFCGWSEKILRSLGMVQLQSF